MAPIVENWAEITGKVQSVSPSTVTGFKTVEVRVEDAKSVASYPNLLDQTVGEVIAVNVPDALADTLPADPEDASVTCRVRRAGPSRLFVHPEHFSAGGKEG